MSNKRFYWLKLLDDFFDQREIKKLRLLAGGDTYTIIYLKIQLLSLKNNGDIIFEATEKDIFEQLSLELDEKVNDIKMTLLFLKENMLVDISQNQNVELLKTKELIGITTDGAQRVAKHRAKKKKELIEVKENKALHCNTDVTDSNDVVTEREDIELEKDIELEIEREQDNKEIDLKTTPSLSQVEFIFKKLNLKSNPSTFFYYYNNNSWKKNNGKVVNLETLESDAKVWESREFNLQKNTRSNYSKNSNSEGYNLEGMEV